MQFLWRCVLKFCSIKINFSFWHVVISFWHVDFYKLFLLAFLQWILHDWDDKQCLKILKNCYEAIPEDGKVLIVDTVLDEEEGMNRQTGLLFDMCMMAASIGGKERTWKQFEDMFYRTGFNSYRVITLPFLQSFIEISTH